jgi:hypothetical protein
MQRWLRSSEAIGRLVITLLLTTATAAALAGSVGLRQTAAQEITTRAIVLHAATDLGKIEVHFNNDEVADEFEYGDQTDWIDVDPGTLQVWITRDRAGFNYTVFNSVYPVPAGNDYYFVITDALVMSGTFDRSPLADGTARVQLTHASLDSPTVNVVATGTESSMATELAFARSSEVVEVPAGTADVEVRLVDTGDALLTTSGITAEAGMTYQYFLIGDPNDEDKPIEIRALSTTTQDGPMATPGA